MAEHDETKVGRKRPDFLTMFAGIATLFVSAYVLTDGQIWVPMLDPRWLVAGGAVVVGLLLLASSMRGKGKRE
ncbi:hypothetical protein [Actinokineospora iranica]|uniref:Uncharacterized protein n=1 Tax=Actinokineospora iranica TaxID=1271860 RepID=A0A1G6Z5S4_9PSEU|nr:hypothetical protein [Actinokineospora iranica]SDD97978.1 hypothetical protein SAMN05216174_12613 [Actinokineospora iranica]